MNCANCGQDNPAEADFCGNCGSTLSRRETPSTYRPFGQQVGERTSMLERMIGALRLNVHIFEEVEADTDATVQAIIVVVLVALATGIGSLGADRAMLGLVLGVVLGLAYWAFWAFITYLIGTTLLRTPGTEANWGELARTTGFAQAPGLLRIFGFIPVIGPAIVFAASIWQFVAMVVAVRQALDYSSTLRAIGVVAVGFVIVLILQAIIFAIV